MTYLRQLCRSNNNSNNVA